MEVDFWKERAESLASIHEQLSGERIQKVVRVLELAHSTYHPAFQRVLKVRGWGGQCRRRTPKRALKLLLCCAASLLRQASLAGLQLLLYAPQDVEAALLEATDNVRFLAPLRRHLEKLSLMDDFVALVRGWEISVGLQRLHVGAPAWHVPAASRAARQTLSHCLKLIRWICSSPSCIPRSSFGSTAAFTTRLRAWQRCCMRSATTSSLRWVGLLVGGRKYQVISPSCWQPMMAVRTSGGAVIFAAYLALNPETPQQKTTWCVCRRSALHLGKSCCALTRAKRWTSCG